MENLSLATFALTLAATLWAVSLPKLPPALRLLAAVVGVALIWLGVRAPLMLPVEQWVRIAAEAVAVAILLTSSAHYVYKVARSGHSADTQQG